MREKMKKSSLLAKFITRVILLSTSKKRVFLGVLVLFCTFALSCGKESSIDIDIDISEGTQLRFDLSSDGKQIAFDLLGQLWLIPSDGGNAIPVTDAVVDRSYDLDPVFSPDCKKIVFSSDRPEGIGLWLLELASGNTKRLTSDAGFQPAWSPDGKLIAFARRGGLYIYNFTQETETKIDFSGLSSPRLVYPSWSPSGDKIFFTSAQSIWSASSSGGEASRVLEKGSLGFFPEISPNGNKIAYFSKDTADRNQVWLMDIKTGENKKLTNHDDISSFRIRWSPDGSSIYYSADGKIWRLNPASLDITEVPFVAKVKLARKKYSHQKIKFSESNVSLPARGHMGLAISYQGDRIAMIALGKLWIFSLNGEPQPVASIPFGAAGLSWNPDGKEVVWSAGPGGMEDFFITDVETGVTRQVTRLPGSELRPSWSPDGKKIAFVYWKKPILPTDPWERKDSRAELRVLDVDQELIEDPDSTINLGEADGWMYRFSGNWKIPLWSHDSEHLLWIGNNPEIISLRGERKAVDSMPKTATFINWYSHDTIAFVHDDLIWQATFSQDSGTFGLPVKLTNDPAVFLTVSNQGYGLYRSVDGLRVLMPDGEVKKLGWPVEYTTPARPESILIHDVIVFDGRSDSSLTHRDILIKNGRISKIASVGDISYEEGLKVIDAEGRTIIPGLINLHEHIWDEMIVPGLLYYGITTFREMGSAIGQVAGLRDAIDAGVFPGPRIIFGAWQFYEGDGYSGEFGHGPKNLEGQKRAVSLLKSFGAEYLKFRGFKGMNSAVEFIRLAHQEGFPVSGHIAIPFPMVAEGMDGMEHLGPSGIRTNRILYEDIVHLFRAADMWLVPTVAAYSSSVRFHENPNLLDWTETSPFVSPFMRNWGLGSRPSYAKSARSFAELTRNGTKKLFKAGVRIGAGSDVPSAPWALHWELEELVASGLAPAEALSAATSVAAQILGADQEIGTIEKGKLADLVILDGDPIKDIRNTQKIWMVMKGGQIIDREMLRTLTAEWNVGK
jgi:Tol biopolymer transport system component